MASPASGNAISKETIEAFLDRMEGLEDDATKIMMDAMSECRDGPRADQKELRKEIKNAGVRMKAFNALWTARKAQRKPQKAFDALEDDDRDQMSELAAQLSDTPFGAYVKRLLDEAPL
jgi:uncharacterized protein (UPF0335 family)